MSVTYVRDIVDQAAGRDSAYGGFVIRETVVLSRLVDGVGASIAADELETLQDGTILPRNLDRYVDWYSLGGSFGSSLNSTLRLRSIDASRVPNSFSEITVQLTWGTRYVRDFEKGTIWLPKVVRAQPRVRAAKVFRSLAFASPPSGSSPGGSDIGGTKVDAAGVPIDLPLRENLIVVSGLVDAYSNGVDSNLENGRNFIGRVVSNAMFNFPAYSLRVEDWNVAHEIDEYYAVAISLVWSPWFHCIQAPRRDADGKVQISGSPLRATFVEWQRETNDTVNLASLFSAFEQYRIQYGLKTGAP